MADPGPQILALTPCCAAPTQVTFDVNNPAFKLDDLLALELHKFEEEVGEIVERAQKEEKMEQGLNKLQDTWGRVAFQFHQHKDTPVYTVKMAEEDFEVCGSQVYAAVRVLVFDCYRGALQKVLMWSNCRQMWP
jgi:hypothetical protein